jgi:hypothetical protein
MKPAIFVGLVASKIENFRFAVLKQGAQAFH